MMKLPYVLRRLSLRGFQVVAAAAFLSLACAVGRAQSRPYVTANAPLLGSAWYPEQWPEDRWEADLALMEKAHFNVVRIGEFAWSTMEPAEGRYQLDWLDRAIALAARHHIAVVLGTPTDAPPAWLTTRYPQTLRMEESGVRAKHGGRRQFNYANPLYRRFCAKIVLELARHYGHNANVIGWQIGNEYTDESFDPQTRSLFQEFLRHRYKSLASLNAHGATAYWSQSYTDWSQIPLAAKSGNPGLLLEHKHFVTATWRSFQRNQIDVLRPLIASSQFITTNIGGLAWSDNWDHYAITADLDLASWDDYVGRGHLNAPRNAMLNDFVRGWRGQNFWVMETQPGSVNWAPVNNVLSRGETRALVWQTIGHGADAILFWQWRSALNGQEQYHGAIVGPDGEPLPIYGELQKLGADLERTRTALADTSPHARIGLLHTYDSRWVIDFQPQTRFYDQEDVLLRFYTPLEHLTEAAGEAVDIIDPTRFPLDSYRLLVAPSLNVIDSALGQKLRFWVKSGGHLLLGPRSGMKDEFDALQPERQPGPMANALGANVEQYYAPDHKLRLGNANTLATPALPDAASADTWAEALKVSDSSTQAVLRYVEPGGWLDGQPAMVTRHLGKGTISYLGTLPDAATLDGLLGVAVRDVGITGTNQIPAGVELCVRSDRSRPGRRSVYIVINHSEASAEATIAGHLRSLLKGQTVTYAVAGSASVTTHIALPAQGVALLISAPDQP